MNELQTRALSIMTNPRNYMKYWFEIHNKRVKDAISEPETFGSIFIDYNLMFSQFKRENESKIKPLSKDMLIFGYNEFVSSELKRERDEDLVSFRTTGEDLSHIKKWLKAITGDEKHIEVCVMAHWLWSIKRKAYKLPVIHHIMPVFYGPQGSGKSIGITKLISPLDRYKITMQMNKLGDDRSFEAMSYNLIVFFDELQSIERTDVNVLKNQITTQGNTYRKLHTHNMVTVPQSCSFIGATNKPFSESFSDHTGQRRFYEITSLNKTDWETVNSIDYIALWHGIDENKEKGYLEGEVLQELSDNQESLINQDDIQIYIEDRNLQPKGNDEVKSMSLDVLFKDYQMWTIEYAISKPANKIWFSRRLKGRGLLPFKKSNSRSIVRHFQVNTAHTVGETLTNNSKLKVV